MFTWKKFVVFVAFLLHHFVALILIHSVAAKGNHARTQVKSSLRKRRAFSAFSAKWTLQSFSFVKHTTIAPYFWSAAFFIEIVHISLLLKRLPLHKIIIFIYSVSKFTDPYFAKRAAVCILKKHESIFSLSFLFTLVIYTSLSL